VNLSEVNMAAKKAVLKGISEKTGVPVFYLEKYATPWEAEVAADALMPFVGKDSEKEPEPKVECVKCGTTIKPMVKAWVRGSLSGAVEEHLDVECCICKYTWQKPTWEQEQKAKAPTKLPEDAKTLAAKKFNTILDEMLKDAMTKPPKPNIFEQAVGLAPGPKLSIWNDPIMEDCCDCDDDECPDNPGFTGKR
jgi:hypothetical protein